MSKCGVVVIFTCFNRKEKSMACIQSIVEGNPESQVHFVVVDDNSTDGTEQMLKASRYDLHYLKGTGSLYWAGGMRKGIRHFLTQPAFCDVDYVLLVNDDVAFFESSLDKMIALSRTKPSAVIVGNCCDSSGILSYGAIKFYKNKLRKIYHHLDINSAHVNADAFNCNCVLFPAWMTRQLGNFDEHYSHSFADYDYGVCVRRIGFDIYGTDFYVGVCDKNSLEKTWRNPNLPMSVRLKMKEQPKGLPFREYFYFLNKNVGFVWALRYAFTPYLRILLRK